MRGARPRCTALAIACALATAPAALAELDVFTDALASGWQDWSFPAPGIAVDLASTTHVHSGSKAIAITFGAADAALSLRTATPLAGASYLAIDLWVYGAGATGTHLALATEATDSGPVSSAYELVAPSGAWTHFTVPLASLGSPATIARIDLQDDGNEDPNATFWVDDLVVTTPAGAVPIFSDGFESGDTSAWCAGCAGTPTGPLAVVAGTTNVGGTPLPSHAFSWVDADGLPRQAVMIDQRSGGNPGAGYLRQIVYRHDGVDRVCTGIDSGGGIRGMGYVENHTAAGPDDWTVGTAGTTTLVLAGRHHAIVQYDMPAHTLAGRTVPTTVQWFFATGRSHPLFIVAQDASALAPNLGADSRSPYGTMDIGCDGGGHRIGGISWGDTYKFVTLVNGTASESTTLSSTSGWRYTEGNSIPYVLAWMGDVDAEEGTVATSPIFYQDQGSDPRSGAGSFGKNQQDIDGPMPGADD